MWKRCWWATWISGFFGITGALHIAQLVINIPVRIGTHIISRFEAAIVGIICLAISVGLLWLEWIKEQAKRRAAGAQP